MALGKANCAEVANPPSPKPKVPPPATVVILPPISTFLIQKLFPSDINTFPLESNATELGPFNCARVAFPPSPLKPLLPVPAKVLMMPFLLIFLILLFHVSAMYLFP